jgi:FlaA1/EpsC-like NDP-sugar epimerase
MTRFFMTIPEAASLVVQAGAMGGRGQVYVLDMGEPVKILDLARELIRRNGLEPDKDMAIRFSGIRPGEKLYEELACDDDQTRPTAHEKIRVWQLSRPSAVEVGEGLERLQIAIEGTPQDAVDALKWCVPEFRQGIGTKPSAKPHLRLVVEASQAPDAPVAA